jgi:hypothetical protein
MGQSMKNLKICYALKGIRLTKGEKARGQIIIGTPGTTMDWVIKYKSINPAYIKVGKIWYFQFICVWLLLNPLKYCRFSQSQNIFF